MLYVTVELFGRKGLKGEFRDYEKKALDLFRKHGGEVIVAFAPSRQPGQIDIPDEIQILKIATQSAFDAFMQDPQRTQMAAERDAVIGKTTVRISEEIIDY